jgi:hypothetical protein
MYAEWASRKRDIALNLASGECNGSYEEAVIILCTALGGLAAQVWPGEGKDRVRFVEVLAQFAPVEYGVTRVSLPILLDVLRDTNLAAEYGSLVPSHVDFGGSRVLTGDQVDKDEADILSICATVPVKLIRECSYAALLYKEIRCSWVHEYRSGYRAEKWPMSRTTDSLVGYSNRLDDDGHSHRRIHFHIERIGTLVLQIAEALDAVGTLPLAEGVVGEAESLPSATMSMTRPRNAG